MSLLAKGLATSIELVSRGGRSVGTDSGTTGETGEFAVAIDMGMGFPDRSIVQGGGARDRGI
jgi:hypothetical protein